MTDLFGPQFWNEIHGGSTHFPIAMIAAALLFDGIALSRYPNDRERSRDLHAAAHYSLLLGAVCAFGAVVSGLAISGWETFGSGALGLHHRFVWPAFGLLVGLAVWRLLVRDRASRNAMMICFAVECVSTGLMLLAGYQGGKMMLGS
jgi:uncharacterized membrane protein